MERKRQIAYRIIWGLLVLLVGIGAWAARDTFATARIGTTYVAKQTCSCLFVAGRPPDSCRTDFDPSALQSLDIVAGSNVVTVSALSGLISSRSEFDQGYGCHPVN